MYARTRDRTKKLLEMRIDRSDRDTFIITLNKAELRAVKTAAEEVITRGGMFRGLGLKRPEVYTMRQFVKAFVQLWDIIHLD